MKEARETPDDSKMNQEQAEAPSDPGNPFQIPPEGSLGLLALGAVGITEWRYARERAKKASETSTPDSAAEERQGTDGE